MLLKADLGKILGRQANWITPMICRPAGQDRLLARRNCPTTRRTRTLSFGSADLTGDGCKLFGFEWDGRYRKCGTLP
jgi:hypothetical protein